MELMGGWFKFTFCFMYLKLPSFILHTTFNLSQGIDTLLVIHRFTVILIKIIRRILRRLERRGAAVGWDVALEVAPRSEKSRRYTV